MNDGLETIDIFALDDLSAETLYTLEVKSLRRVSREEEPGQVERAQQGDGEARQALLKSCLRYLRLKALDLYYERRPVHTDVMDLVGVANLAIVEGLEKALQTREPFLYLIGIGLKQMRVYCTYHAPLIRRPEMSIKEVIRLDPYPASASVESLNTPLYDSDGRRLWIEQIEAPAINLDQSAYEKSKQEQFALLYEAIAQLSPLQRETILRLYGLLGQPAEDTSELAGSHEQAQMLRVYSRATSARKRLRTLLEGKLSAMVEPAPEEDEGADE